MRYPFALSRTYRQLYAETASMRILSTTFVFNGVSDCIANYAKYPSSTQYGLIKSIEITSVTSEHMLLLSRWGQPSSRKFWGRQTADGWKWHTWKDITPASVIQILCSKFPGLEKLRLFVRKTDALGGLRWLKEGSIVVDGVCIEMM